MTHTYKPDPYAHVNIHRMPVDCAGHHHHRDGTVSFDRSSWTCNNCDCGFDKAPIHTPTDTGLI